MKRTRVGAGVVVAIWLCNAFQCGRNYQIDQQRKFLADLRAERESMLVIPPGAVFDSCTIYGRDSIVTVEPDVIAETFPRRDGI